MDNQTTTEVTSDLCAELVTSMERLEFNQSSVQAVINNKYFQTAMGLQSHLQRTYLILAFSDIFNNGPEVVPRDIRLALNVAHDDKSWHTDVNLTLLPFLKMNEGVFFN